MGDIAYINGSFMDLDKAMIPIEDRGFQFGDGVYEVIVAHSGQPFLLDAHLDRLQRSADGIGLGLDCSGLNLPEVIQRGIAESGYRDAMIYLQITRGAAAREHAYPGGMQPNVVLTFKPKPIYDAAFRSVGVDLETTADIRWGHCNIKSIALLANVMIKNAAKHRGLFDAIILTRDGEVLETSCANVFVVTEGVLRTPPADHRILHGVTRGFLLETARQEGIPCEERSISLASLLAADEVLITSTSIDVLAVRSIDGQKIGREQDSQWQPGAMAQRLLECFPQPART